VCHKWLKDRKRRTGQRVVAALAETIELMGQIDVTIEEHGGWPVE